MEKIGYVRISTEAQNEARQKEIMNRYGVKKLFIDKLSGKDIERPELKRMLEYVREGDILFIESISRLARSTKDLLEIVGILDKKGVHFVSDKESIDTASPQGKFMLTVFAAMAQLERECTLQRIREGVAIAKEAGKYKGRPPRPLDEINGIFEKWKSKGITATAAAKKLGVSRATFYRRMKQLEKDEYIDF